MSAVNRAAVEAVLRQYTDPHLNQDPVSAGCVRAIDIQGDAASACTWSWAMPPVCSRAAGRRCCKWPSRAWTA